MFLRLVTAILIASLSATAALAAPPMKSMPALPPQPKIHPVGIPANAVMVSPCVRTMGEHWAVLKNLPNGPIYGVYADKPIFTELMFSVQQLKKGVSYDNLQALPGYTINHIDFEYEPHGHEGFPVPHYDLHAYYVSAAMQATICPNGIPDPAMKPNPAK